MLEKQGFYLDERDEWIILGEFLEDELKGCLKCLLQTKSMQGLEIQPSGSKMDSTWKSGDSDRNKKVPRRTTMWI